MAIEDVKQLKTVTVEAQAQELLNEGWMLLGLFDRQEGSSQWTEFHLGKAADPKPAQKHPTAADMARANNL